MDLSALRREIDAINNEMLSLFLRRMEVSEQVMDYKIAHGMAVRDEKREKEIINAVREKSGERGEYAARLFECLMELSREQQNSRINAPIFGLIGRGAEHSYSARIHSRFGMKDYRLIDLEPDELDSFMKNGNIAGLNVTIPYKREALRFCAALSDEARETGSVNTLVRSPLGLVGHNTDVFGLRYALERAGIELQGKKVLVFGSGGASFTARYVAARAGAASVTVISRTGENNYENLHLHKDAQIIINATPVGAFPDNGAVIADLSRFPLCEGVADMIYNPRRTALIMQAETLNIAHTDGLPMLVAQAALAEKLFCGKETEEGEIARVLAAMRRDSANIVIIGMPGCGKSIVGRALQKLTGRRLLDIDEEIVKSAGCSIEDIFARDGEAEFRRLEAERISHAGRQSGVIIVTGGGAVKDRKNYPPLHQNGRIYHIERELTELDRAGRPLSLNADLCEMYAERLPMYEYFRDSVVQSGGFEDKTAALIWEDFCENADK